MDNNVNGGGEAATDTRRESTAPTQEQLEEAVEFLRAVLEGGFPRNEWEQSCVQRILTTLERRAADGRPAEGKAPRAPEAPSDDLGSMADEGGGYTLDESTPADQAPQDKTEEDAPVVDASGDPLFASSYPKDAAQDGQNGNGGQDGNGVQGAGKELYGGAMVKWGKDIRGNVIYRPEGSRSRDINGNWKLGDGTTVSGNGMIVSKPKAQGGAGPGPNAAQPGQNFAQNPAGGAQPAEIGGASVFKGAMVKSGTDIGGNDVYKPQSGVVGKDMLGRWKMADGGFVTTTGLYIPPKPTKKKPVNGQGPGARLDGGPAM